MPYSSHQQQIRPLQSVDMYMVERLVRTSEYVYQRFTSSELPRLLQRYPASGIYHDATMYGFMLSQILDVPCAWIAGFGISWTESRNYITVFDRLLEHLSTLLRAKGGRHLYYSGSDVERDWLRPILLMRGFVPYRRLCAYDKYDFSIPTAGNEQVVIRPVCMESDLVALLDLDMTCFEDLWRHNAVAFRDIAETHPYFVVAELDGRVVGYQFNARDSEFGYLVRIAVHPSVRGQGIGARLMAEAIHYFRRARVERIMLNTQEDNYHAHRLYEWFGFIRLQQIGFVLRKTLS
jgi:ribosomal-protein-alanine N-acetyltransferase